MATHCCRSRRSSTICRRGRNANVKKGDEPCGPSPFPYQQTAELLVVITEDAGQTREELPLACRRTFLIARGHHALELDLEVDIEAAVDTGTGRDQVTDDDVLLQSDQLVTCTAHRGIREHARRFLE